MRMGMWLLLALWPWHVNYAQSAGAGLRDVDLVAAPFLTPAYAGTIDDEALTEISGLAAGRRNGDVLFAVSDSGDGNFLYALDTVGRRLATYTLEGVINQDFEDLASFSDDGRSWLLVADIGDNGARRSQVQLHLLREPRVSPGEQRSLKVAATLSFSYENGPRDAESVAVDVADQAIYVLSKREVPAVLYRLPLGYRSATLVAKVVTPVPGLPQPQPADFKLSPSARYRSQPTAMDIDAAGRRAIVMTYWHAYLFERTEEQSWAQAFAQRPALLWLPPLPQAEAIAFDARGHRLYITSERRPAPLVRVSLSRAARNAAPASARP